MPRRTSPNSGETPGTPAAPPQLKPTRHDLDPRKETPHHLRRISYRTRPALNSRLHPPLTDHLIHRRHRRDHCIRRRIPDPRVRQMMSSQRWIDPHPALPETRTIPHSPVSPTAEKPLHHPATRPRQLRRIQHHRRILRPQLGRQKSLNCEAVFRSSRPSVRISAAFGQRSSLSSKFPSQTGICGLRANCESRYPPITIPEAICNAARPRKTCQALSPSHP